MAQFMTESFAFLKELSENNNREWFNENKTRFKTHLEAPFIALLEALTNRLTDAKRPLVGDKSTMFRMNRDTRFSENKLPYKTNLSGMLTPTSTKSEGAGILYIQLDATGGFAAAGFYNLLPKQLIPIRDAIIERDSVFDDVLSALTERKRNLSDDHSLSSMPRGYAEHAEHRHAAHLRRKSLLLQEPLTTEDWTTGDVIDKIEAMGRDAMPLLTFQDPARLERKAS